MPRDGLTIRKIISGGKPRWEWSIEYPMPDGDRRRVRRRFDSKSEAEAAYKKAVAERDRIIDAGSPSSDHDQTLLAFLREWWSGLVIEENTSDQYRWAIDHIERALTSKGQNPRVTEFKSAAQVSAIINNLTYAEVNSTGFRTGRSGPLGATSRFHVQKVLRVALQVAVNDGRLARNPCDMVAANAKAKPEYKEMDTWTADDATRFVATAINDPLFPAMILMLSRGMRREEILGLWWTDINFESATLSLQRAWVNTSNGAGRMSAGKNKGAHRPIQLDSWLLQILKAHQLDQKKARLAATTWSSTEPWVFCWPTAGGNRGTRHQPGDPYRPAVLSERFQSLVKRLELPPIRLYDLRHTAATLQLIMGVHVKVVQEMLGHSRISTTIDTYSHTTASMHSEAGERLTNLIRGVAEG